MIPYIFSVENQNTLSYMDLTPVCGPQSLQTDMENCIKEFENEPSDKLISHKHGFIRKRHIEWLLVEQTHANPEAVINIYMQLLNDHSEQKGGWRFLPVIAHFGAYLEKYGYTVAKRQITVDIFNCEVILLPIQRGNRWCIAFVQLIRNRIELYGSFDQADGDDLITKIDAYLKTEFLNQNRKALDTSKWVKETANNFPMQTNICESAVYICMIANLIANNKYFHLHEFSHLHEIPANFKEKMLYEIIREQILD